MYIYIYTVFFQVWNSRAIPVKCIDQHCSLNTGILSSSRPQQATQRSQVMKTVLSVHQSLQT